MWVPAAADSKLAPETPARHREVSLADAPDGLQRLATAIVVENLPLKYEDNRDWGKTKRVFRGIKLRREGLKIETKRRKKHVNHGTWKRFRLTQINPRENTKARILNVRQLEDGRMAFRLELISRVNAYARLSEWNRGVRLASISLDADADVLLNLDCNVEVEVLPTRIPPDVVIKPEVTDAGLRVRRFRVNRVSHFDGPVARELGDSLKDVLLDKVNDSRPKLVSKINRQIAKNDDKLRFSLSDMLMDKWRGLTEPREVDTSQKDDHSITHHESVTE